MGVGGGSDRTGRAGNSLESALALPPPRFPLSHLKINRRGRALESVCS